jgi:hypothetical protein
MAEGDFMGDRRRASEEDYFRKKDRELIEKMRKQAADDQARREMGARIRVNDPVLVQDLQAMGFTPDTVKVLPLVPIVKLAWTEGGITSAERKLLVTLARERGISEGSAADQLLSDWMAHAPTPELFNNAMRLVRAMLAAQAPDADTITADDLLRYCEIIAEASGGVFGIGKVSAEERATLDEIAKELKTRG